MRQLDRLAAWWLTRRWQQDTIPREDRCYRLVTGARAVILSPGVIHPPGLVIDRPSFITDIDPLRPHIVTRPEFPTATFTS